MKAAIYNRISRETQGDPAKAMEDLRAAAAQRGYKVAMEVAEQGSGARNDRPGLQRILEAARAGKIAAVLVQRLDRFGRSTLDLLANIESLSKAGVRFTCTEQDIDVGGKGDAMSKFMLTVMSGVAQFERDMGRERIVEGQRRAKKKGKHIGRSFADNAPHADVVEKLRVKGMSWPSVANVLGCSISQARRAVGLHEKSRQAAPREAA